MTENENVIPGAAILAAEAAAFDEMIEHGPDGRTDGHDKITRAILEAAAPHIRAQALEEAASELDGKRLLHKPFHEYYPEWLRNRAGTERHAL